jgi:hypothetical protein
MAWTTPRTWVTSELVTAAVMNAHVRDNLVYLKAALFIKGMVLPFSGTLGGVNNHFPIDPDTAAADTRWHICNGDTENSVATPDLRDRFVLAAGTTYAAAATGGAAAKDLAHTHAAGTYTGPSHRHGVGDLATVAGVTNENAVAKGVTAGGESAAGFAHDHYIPVLGITGNTGYAGNAAITGSSASGGSATQDIMPPYYALTYICYVGTA